jgi:MerR family transcriptional regulator, heat shock protein HspR
MYLEARKPVSETRSRAITARDNPDRGVYAISVAGELTGVDPQMLRIYENRGLLKPARTDGGTRRYSGHDLDRIEQITAYLTAGLNLAGIERVFALEAEADVLRTRIRTLERRATRQT